MGSRMERYQQRQASDVLDRTIKNTRLSRTSRNQELYQDFHRGDRYRGMYDLEEDNVIDLSTVNRDATTRENYQKVKEIVSIMQEPKEKRKLEEYRTLYPEKDKVYDINQILTKAKESRGEDLMEERRKLKKQEYNVLSGMNQQELEKFREEKRRQIEALQKENDAIKTLIDQITVNTLAGQLDPNSTKELLSDLLPTSNTETIVTQSLVEELKQEKVKESQGTASSHMQNADPSFYTRSMDLSDEDFETDDEFADVKENKGLLLVLRIGLFLLLVAIMTTLIYFILHKL